MPRYSVPLTILASITVDAPDAASARKEAVRFAEGHGSDTGLFMDGWNDVQRQHGLPTIHDVSGFDCEGVELMEVEEIDDEPETCTHCGEERPAGPQSSSWTCPNNHYNAPEA